MSERKCRQCGCTDEMACVTLVGPCWWVEEDLCSACAEPKLDDPRRDADGLRMAVPRTPRLKPLELTGEDLAVVELLPPLVMELDGKHALALVGICDLALQNPRYECGPGLRMFIQELRQSLEEHLAVTPELAAVVAAGKPAEQAAPAPEPHRIIIPPGVSV